MSKIVITGGAGFTGANFAKRYMQDHDVTIYDNLSRKGSIENIEWLRSDPASENLNLVVGDLRAPTKNLREAIEAADVLFHFAGQVAVTTSVTEPREDFEINALGTFNILELLRNSRGNKPVLMFSSTNKVYGGMEEVVTQEGETTYTYRDLPQGVDEHQPLDFHSPYGCSKGCADQYVRDYGRIYDLSTVVMRQSCIYGYRQFGIEDQGWVAWFIIATILGRPLTIYGNGKQVRDVLFIEDLIEAYDKAWKNIKKTSGQVYNIGGGSENAISLIMLLNYLEHDMGLDLKTSYDDWRPGDQPIYVSNIAKATEQFGWRPNTDWKTGVRTLVDWVKANREMLDRMF